MAAHSYRPAMHRPAKLPPDFSTAPIAASLFPVLILVAMKVLRMINAKIALPRLIPSTAVAFTKFGVDEPTSVKDAPPHVVHAASSATNGPGFRLSTSWSPAPRR